MKMIFLSGPHGAGCSMIKSLALGINKINDENGTCHESWNAEQTTNGDSILFSHDYDLAHIRKAYFPDITAWLKIDKTTAVTLCKRIVVLDFLYAHDPFWVNNDYSWTPAKHNRLAGPDWPKYSTNIKDYPTWCLNEMCQVAYDRVEPWLMSRPDFDYQIDYAELIGNKEPVTLKQFINGIGCHFDYDFFDLWKSKNYSIIQEYEYLFTWDVNWTQPDGWHDKVEQQ